MQPLQCFYLSFLLARLAAAASILPPSVSLINSDPTLNITFPTDRNISPALNASNGISSHTRFNDTVHIGVVATLRKFPTARFLQVQITPDDGPTGDPELLTDVKLIFALTASATIYVEMLEWGQWGVPRVVPHPPPPDDAPLPPNIDLDLLDADRLIKQAGFMQFYDTVDVRWPTDIPLSRQQVYYLFGMVGDGPSEIAVGVRDHIVQARDSKSSMHVNVSSSS